MNDYSSASLDNPRRKDRQVGLVLTRHVDETIFIYDNSITDPVLREADKITLRVTDISGEKVRIGLKASKRYSISRGELEYPNSPQQGLAGNLQ